MPGLNIAVADKGKLIWEAAGLTGNVIPMPVMGHGMTYVMSGFQGYSIQAIKLSSRGDVSGTDNIVWSVRRGAPYVPSPILSGDRLYMSKGNDAFLSCLNAQTGETIYQDQRLEGLRGIYASPLAANGYLYVVGREGMVMVLKDAATFEAKRGATPFTDKPVAIQSLAPELTGLTGVRVVLLAGRIAERIER